MTRIAFTRSPEVARQPRRLAHECPTGFSTYVAVSRRRPEKSGIEEDPSGAKHSQRRWTRRLGARPPQQPSGKGGKIDWVCPQMWTNRKGLTNLATEVLHHPSLARKNLRNVAVHASTGTTRTNCQDAQACIHNPRESGGGLCYSRNPLWFAPHTPQSRSSRVDCLALAQAALQILSRSFLARLRCPCSRFPESGTNRDLVGGGSATWG